MNRELKTFAFQWLRMAVMGLAPVVLTAFISIPASLGHHPCEAVAQAEPAYKHMT